MWTSDRRIYLAPDGTVSDEPVTGGTLLVPKGGELSLADASKYGLNGAPKARKGLENKALKGGTA